MWYVYTKEYYSDAIRDDLVKLAFKFLEIEKWHPERGIPDWQQSHGCQKDNHDIHSLVDIKCKAKEKYNSHLQVGLLTKSTPRWVHMDHPDKGTKMRCTWKTWG